MDQYSLSFVITTYNKLEFLKIVVQNVLENIQNDEELIVIDGGSTDGSATYLQDLYTKGVINQYVSEKDFGEAHGFNKGILMAKGSLIKIITDDDIFDFQVINSCKSYMLENTGVDAMTANICSFNATQSPSKLILVKSYEVWFKNWVLRHSPNCFFCGLPMLLRKKAVPHLGLFDTSFKHIDLEYSVRITSKKNIKIAFSSAVMVTAFLNTQSISQNFGGIAEKEVKRVSSFYDFDYPLAQTKQNKKLSDRIKKKLSLGNTSAAIDNTDYNHVLEDNLVFENLDTSFSELALVMKKYNANTTPEILLSYE